MGMVTGLDVRRCSGNHSVFARRSHIPQS